VRGGRGAQSATGVDVKILIAVLVLLVCGALAAGGGVLYVFHHYGKDLPDYKQLADYDPPTVTRVHAGDGRLLAEYATQKRVFVPIQAIPKRVVNAFQRLPGGRRQELLQPPGRRFHGGLAGRRHQRDP
jgi:membrane peptidoglycan carboxypeptidase